VSGFENSSGPGPVSLTANLILRQAAQQGHTEKGDYLLNSVKNHPGLAKPKGSGPPLPFGFFSRHKKPFLLPARYPVLYC